MIWLDSLKIFPTLALALLLLQSVGCSAPQSAESSEPITAVTAPLILSPQSKVIAENSQWPDIGVTLLSSTSESCTQVAFKVADLGIQTINIGVYEGVASATSKIDKGELNTLMGAPTTGDFQVNVTCTTATSTYTSVTKLIVVPTAELVALSFVKVNNLNIVSVNGAGNPTFSSSDSWVTAAMICTDGNDVKLSIHAASGSSFEELSIPLKASCYGGEFTASFFFPAGLNGKIKTGDKVVIKAESLNTATGVANAETSVILSVAN